MKTGLITIHRNLTCYTIFQKATQVEFVRPILILELFSLAKITVSIKVTLTENTC